MHAAKVKGGALIRKDKKELFFFVLFCPPYSGFQIVGD
jgi:hypothetical protein